MTTKIRHDQNSQAIARQRQLNEPEMPKLVRSTSHELKPGDRCTYRSAAPDDSTVWHVIALSKSSFWVYVSDRPQTSEQRHDCVKQWFPTDCMLPYDGKRTRTTKPATPPDPTKPIQHTAPTLSRGKRAPAKGQDDIALRLGEADTLDELWAMAAQLGLPDAPAVRVKLAHLNPGLQRMNIGNRLRAIKRKATKK